MDKNPRFPKGKNKKVKIFITKFWETHGIIVTTGVILKEVNRIVTDKFINHESTFIIEIDCESTLEKAIKKIKKERKKLIEELETRLLKLQQNEEFFYKKSLTK